MMSSALLAVSAMLAWEASPEAVSYQLYVGRFSLRAGNPPIAIYPTTALQYEVDGLSFGVTYFFVVTAFNEFGLESGYSNEVEHVPLLPEPTPTPTPTPDLPGQRKGWYK